MFQTNKANELVSGRIFLAVHIIENIQGFFVAPNNKRIKTYFSLMNFMNSLSGDYQPEKVGYKKMK